MTGTEPSPGPARTHPAGRRRPVHEIPGIVREDAYYIPGLRWRGPGGGG
jgi:hypothetical protein